MNLPMNLHIIKGICNMWYWLGKDKEKAIILLLVVLNKYPCSLEMSVRVKVRILPSFMS